VQTKETKVERIRRESTNRSIAKFNADVAAGGLPKKRKNGRAKGKRGENAVAKLFADLVVASSSRASNFEARQAQAAGRRRSARALQGGR
jgi:hypothetical protein